MSTLSELTAQRDDVMAELAEIESLSDEGRNRILDAIKAQRWYFFKNNKYILMDKLTGLLWANLDYFNYKDGTIGNFDEVSRITEWAVPRPAEMIRIVEDARFPFKSGARRIKSNDRAYWKISTSNDIRKATGDISLDTWNTDSNPTGCLIPCNRSLLADKTTYAQDVDPNNKIYSETERLQFTLDLFTQNDLWPIFNDDEITQLYGKIYIDKPALLGKLQELNEQIAPLMTTRILSSEFDYTAMLAQYDLPAV
ncbi:MAG: hypothetical protein IJF90_12200, partial [Synergistaceae bacterium]|nr:hypothetical protein [Synergistaceae bacterium]